MENISIIKKISPNCLDKKGNLKSIEKQLLEYEYGLKKDSLPFVVNEQSSKLKYAEFKNNPLVINVSTIEKLKNKHELDLKFLIGIDNIIENSIFAFDSLKHESSKIFVTDIIVNDNPLIFIARNDKQMSVFSVNEITSIYDRSNLQNLIHRTVEQGGKAYINPEKVKEFEKMGYDINPKINNINTIVDIASKDYESYIKAIVKIEKGIDDNKILDKVYDEFMNRDNVDLLNDNIDEIINETRIDRDKPQKIDFRYKEEENELEI